MIKNKVRMLKTCHAEYPDLSSKLLEFTDKRDLRRQIDLIQRDKPVVFQVHFYLERWGFILDEPGLFLPMDGPRLSLQPGIITPRFFERLWEGIDWTTQRGEYLFKASSEPRPTAKLFKLRKRQP